MVISEAREQGPEPWEQWAKQPEHEGTLAHRARGELGEMESTKQLTELVREVYRPGMRVLDVGCNAGHYLRGLRRISDSLDYTGVDNYAYYVDQAREIYADDPNARFELKDIHQPLFAVDPIDIVFCCNVLLHLPDFRRPLDNLLAGTRSVLLLRTLMGEHTTKVKRAIVPDLDDAGEPVDYSYLNTWATEHLRAFGRERGWESEHIEDVFDPAVLAGEHGWLKKDRGTHIVEGRQMDGLVTMPWQWLKFTRAAN
jgi:SAM-dependent methyltransferase